MLLLTPFARVAPRATRQSARTFARTLSTLQSNPHIYIHPSHPHPGMNRLSFLPTSPPIPELSVGTSSQVPPTPESFTENPRFLHILQSVITEYATQDPYVQSQAAAMASHSGANLGSGGALFTPPSQRRKNSRYRAAGASGDSSGGASAQGGMGGGRRGGWIHVSDLRHPPDYGRIAEPEDIFGSLEVDGEGQFVDRFGNYQNSGTYRVVTRDGILGLTDFMRERLVERLKVEETYLKSLSDEERENKGGGGV